jgi:hypothetical protein
MSAATTGHRAADARPPRTVGTFVLGLAATLFAALAAGAAGYLLWQAYSPPPGTTLGDLEKATVAALIGLIGVGITSLVAIYGATRQASTALQIARYNADIAERLAKQRAETDHTLLGLRTDTDRTLAGMRSKIDESLARLKVALDVEHAACAELYGVATVYFYALRSIAQGASPVDTLLPAEAAMVASTRQLLYVPEAVRNQWFVFWQRAHEIQRAVAAEAAATEQRDAAKRLIGERTATSGGRLDLREIHVALEKVCRDRIQDAWALRPAAPTATPAPIENSVAP